MKETKRTIKENDMSRCKMSSNIAFNFWNIEVDRKARRRKGEDENVRSGREETVIVASPRNLNTNKMKPSHQTSIVHKFVKSGYQRG